MGACTTNILCCVRNSITILGEIWELVQQTFYVVLEILLQS